MKGVGIIAEFNPFHKGHKYIIEKAKRETGCGFLGVVMSGSFCQRGEPAAFDKFVRTKAALLNGADIVIELPVVYATGAADIFAGGGVSLIEAAGVFSHIAFGMEAENIGVLEKAADILSREPQDFKTALKKHSGEGLSFPKARELALCETSALPSGVLNKPNNILAVEYLKAIKTEKSGLLPVGVERIGGGCNDESFAGEFSSAAAIRLAMREKRFDKIRDALPESAYCLYKEHLAEEAPSLESYKEALRYIILKNKPEGLEKICDITEGLENSIYKNADFKTVEGLITALKSKRYTRSKLSRALLHILLDINKREVIPLPPAPYIRVLGVRREMKALISKLKENAKAPVIVNVKKDMEALDEKAKAVLEKEIFATALHNPKNKASDLTEGLITV